MSFSTAEVEIRGRFTEILQLLNSLDVKEGERLLPSNDPEKAMRGLALVGIYSAVERGVNSYVEEALTEISAHSANIDMCRPEIQAIFFKGQLQSIRDCSMSSFEAKSVELFEAMQEGATFTTSINPFAYRLQNVDGESMVNCCNLLGAKGFTIGPMEKARLNNLKERRNAVSHGRESPVAVGGRLTIGEIRRIHSIADTEVNRFGNHLKEFFEGRFYVQSA